MKILFIHQNFPGQFKHLARVLASDNRNQVVFLTKNTNYDIPGVKKVLHKPTRDPGKQTHPYVVGLESAVLYGQSAARQALELRKRGFNPDVIVGHCGWGETIFIKDIWPDVPLLNYYEFFYRAKGADIGFDPSVKVEIDDILRMRVRNSVNMLCLESGDWGLSPTKWQHSLYPEEYKPKISVIHEGVDTEKLQPNPEVRFTLPNGKTVGKDDEVITYISRNLEPYRGFHMYVKALEDMARRRPNAEFILIGGDDVSYGRRPKDGKSWREVLMKDIQVDLDRVHFVGRVPYADFMKIMQVSNVHVYLTYPFVLSWSVLEAMSMGCCLVASNTSPVQEVITDGENGFLVDFFNPQEISDKVEEVLEDPDQMTHIRENARQFIIDNYDLKRIALPSQLAVIQALIDGKTPPLVASAHEPVLA
ncbi:glycosyltransferase family 4 protein [Rhodovibrionaceae bacterium A322]